MPAGVKTQDQRLDELIVELTAIKEKITYSNEEFVDFRAKN